MEWPGMLSGLLIRSPYIDWILVGAKTWEIRGSSTAKRGRIALIQSGPGPSSGWLIWSASRGRSRSARQTHHPSSCEAQHGAWQRIGAMAMGGRTDFRLAESIPATAGALRKAGGHSRGILVFGVCSDLLALLASRLGGRLKLRFARND